MVGIKKDGRLEEREEIILSMLEEKLDIFVISIVTGVSEEEIRELKNNNIKRKKIERVAPLIQLDRKREKAFNESFKETFSKYFQKGFSEDCSEGYSECFKEIVKEECRRASNEGFKEGIQESQKVYKKPRKESVVPLISYHILLSIKTIEYHSKDGI